MNSFGVGVVKETALPLLALNNLDNFDTVIVFLIFIPKIIRSKLFANDWSIRVWPARALYSSATEDRRVVRDTGG